MTTPRPDQRHHRGGSESAGSRSGSGDTAAALGYPGVPPAVPNLQGAQKIQQNGPNASITLVTLTAAARIWQVVLSYVITSNSAFTPPPIRTYARIYTNAGSSLTGSGNTLAIVQLGVATALQLDSGQSEPPVSGGIPVTAGTTVFLDVNNGVVTANVDQQTSAVVLYSIP